LRCKRVHEHLVEAGGIELPQVQADEIRVKAVGGIYWLARALEVNSRLWLGGIVSRHRDRELLIRVRARGPVERILLVTDGLASHARQALCIFREPVRTGRRGRPRLMLPATVMIARLKKRCRRRCVVEVVREIVQGTGAAVRARVSETQCSVQALINTAYIERLNATFRARLAPLARRTRAGAHKRPTLETGMWLVGATYNFSWAHRSLGERLGGTPTPAMVAGITDHRWSIEELMAFAVPPAELPRWRGRKPRWLLEAEHTA